MTKKKITLILCKNFPATHNRAGDPTYFERTLKAGQKIHTIRFDEKNVWGKRYQDVSNGSRPLSVREWTGIPCHSAQRELAVFENFGLQKVQMAYSSDDAYPRIWVDGKEVKIKRVAKNEGLSVEDFVDLFFCSNKSNTFSAVCIQFSEFRY